MAGRSGIGVLVGGFSRVGALKKHAPLVFNWNFILFLKKEKLSQLRLEFHHIIVFEKEKL